MLTDDSAELQNEIVKIGQAMAAVCDGYEAKIAEIKENVENIVSLIWDLIPFSKIPSVGTLGDAVITAISNSFTDEIEDDILEQSKAEILSRFELDLIAEFAKIDGVIPAQQTALSAGIGQFSRHFIEPVKK